MKRKGITTLIIFIFLILLSSCNLTPMDDGKGVNDYIFPYVKFTLSEDGTYYTAMIVSDAQVSRIHIPALVDDIDGSSIPVKYFSGFEKDGDEENLVSTTFESSSTEIKLNSLNQAVILETITYDTIGEESIYWKNLPDLVHTEEKEFLGWFLLENGEEIHNGDRMIDGYTAVYAGWGSHKFGSTINAKEPTCTESGWTAYHVCQNSGCGYSNKVDLPPLGHSLIQHSAEDSTCTGVGYRESCWECTRCGLFFSDSVGSTEIDDVVIPLKDHTSSGTYGYDETYHWDICSVCGRSFDEEKHSFTPWEDTDGGFNVERECIECTYHEKAPKEHKWSEVESKEPNCTDAGHKAYYKCDNHNGEYTLSLENIVIIDEETLQEEVYIAPKGHTFTSSYESDENYHWHLCSVCGASSEKVAHEFEYTFVVDSEARSMRVERICIDCRKSYSGGSSSNPSAFDISASFGDVNVLKTGYNTWTLSYSKSGAYGCRWTKENGEELITGTDPFTVSYTSGGKGRIIVFCNELDESGKVVDIAFVALTTY